MRWRWLTALPVLGIGVALVVSGIALGDGAQDNHSTVRGNVKPQQLPPKKFRNARLFTRVATSYTTEIGAGRENVRSVFIDFGRNLRVRPGSRPRCTAAIQGTTTAQARQLCPPRSHIGAGQAHVEVLVPVSEDPPIFAPQQFRDLAVTAFNGPNRGQIRFHAYSPTLGPGNTQVVQGRFRRAPGQRFGRRLAVPNVPDVAGGAGSFLMFNAAIRRNTGYVRARCRANRFLWRARWVYTDGTVDVNRHQQRCRKRR